MIYDHANCSDAGLKIGTHSGEDRTQRSQLIGITQRIFLLRACELGDCDTRKHFVD
jgi:hypothetical protein